MLDPLTALGLAANILQFIEYTGKLVLDGYEFYREGSLEDNRSVEDVTQDLKNISSKLTDQPPDLPSEDEAALQSLASKCTDIAQELLTVLDSLKISQGSHQKWRSLRASFRSSMKKDKVRSLEKKLNKLQVQLNTRILTLMSHRQSSVLTSMKALEDVNKELGIDISQQLQTTKAEVLEALKSMPRDAKDSESSVRVWLRLTALVEEARHVATMQGILESLQFEYMKERYSNVKRAHESTFGWIFKDDSCKKHNFHQWLSEEAGVYWISGKAGSGKSTLMKHIWSSDETSQALRTWAGRQGIVVANYYFWSGGGVMQKSQKGLLQSLLLQVLKQCPHLIPTCSPNRWHTDDLWDQPWGLHELADAFANVASQSEQSTRFCFFIDGLDEYDGLESDVISVISKLATSPSIKLCVSSRPWNAFRKAYGKDTDMKLFVQDYTRNDLKRYATEELMKDAQFMEWHRREDTNREIIEEIVRKADGVFLWVYLVVRSLRSGIVDDNSMSELRRRLDALPPTLEQYFRDIFDRIEDFYQEETARIFLIAVHAAQPLSVLTFSFLRGEQIDRDYALTANINAISDSDIADKVKEMQSYLNSRCKDLLEVNKAESDSTLLRYRVDFLHRTVRDFLKTNDMHQMLSRRAKAEFDPRLSLCRMFLAQIKVLFFEDGVQPHLNGLFSQIDEMMHYAQEVEAAYRSSHNPELVPSTPLLDELDRVVTEHSKLHTQVHWTNLRDVPKGLFEEYGQKTFLAAAIQSRLRTYVGTKLKHNPELLHQKRGRPLLDYALRPKIVTPVQLPQRAINVDVDMVSLLLAAGADPNKKVSIYDGTTVWGLFLSSCYVADISATAHHNSWKQIYSAASVLIDHGADPDLVCEVNELGGADSVKLTARYKQNVVMTRWLSVTEILQTALPQKEHADLVKLMEEKRPMSLWRMISWKLYGAE